MMIYFCDRDLDILGNASTQLPDGFRITDDLTVEEIDTGVNTFSCVLPFTDYDRADLEEMVAEGNYILKQSARGDDDNAYDAVYQIVEVECDTSKQEFEVYAEDAGLDLLNTLCGAVTLTGTIDQMMDYFLPSDWSLNIMDAPTSVQTCEWQGESSCTERLLSVVNLWGCELYYSFVIDRLQIIERVVNVIKKRGNQEAIPQLRLNYDLKKIYWKRSIANLVTALEVTGGTPEGAEEPIDLVGYEYSYTDPSTGDVYRVDTETGQMRNETAMAKWSSAIDPDGLWVGSFSFDTQDKAMLAGQARAYLQRHSQVQVNYEVDFEKLPDDVQIGDRVNIIDEDGELYLEARLLRIETCEAEDTQKATIGEYLLRSGGISDRVAQLATDLANARATDKVIQNQMQIITDTVDNMFTLEVDSDVVLAQAHLTARLLNGNKDVKTDYDPNWFKWILRSENGERLLGRGYTYTADMTIIGYASTILCRFIRPQLYDLTDHNNVAITDANLDPIQVSFAGIYNQPVATRNLLKSKLKNLRATVEVGDPNLTREVNLYERGTVNATVQRFWVAEDGEDAGVHITEIPKEEWIADPSAGGGNLLATSRGIVVRDGLRELSSFSGSSVIVGQNKSSHVTISDKRMQLSYNDSARYFAVALLNDDDGMFATGTTYWASVIPEDSHYGSVWKIVELTSATYSNGTNAMSAITVDADGYGFTMSSRLNYDLHISFLTDTPAPYYTLGRRKGDTGLFSLETGMDNHVGGAYSAGVGGYGNDIGANGVASAIIGGSGNKVTNQRAIILGGSDSVASGTHSMAHGWGVNAQGSAQTVLGRFNAPNGSDSPLVTDYAFIIGKGTSDSARSNAMTVDWTGNTTIAGTLTQSSDRRLKEHKAYLDDDAVEFINNLKPAHFIKDGQSHVGFYAQDVKEADKWHCMTGEMNGFMTLGYTEIIAPLVAYVQKLEKRIAELEEREVTH